MKRAGVLMIILVFATDQGCFAQRRDSTLFFGSALSVTQNGFSFIPSFSLGKPAAILDLAIGNKRASFEPQFRFSLSNIVNKAIRSDIPAKDFDWNVSLIYSFAKNFVRK